MEPARTVSSVSCSQLRIAFPCCRHMNASSDSDAHGRPRLVSMLRSRTSTTPSRSRPARSRVPACRYWPASIRRSAISTLLYGPTDNPAPGAGQDGSRHSPRAFLSNAPEHFSSIRGGNDRPKERPLVAQGPLCSYASTVCVVARLREQVGNGDDVVNRIPGNIATE
jgi:hypothetical protein